MKGLTKRQREIVDFIQEFIASNRYSPSYREICQHFGYTSVGSIYKHINALKSKGAILGQSRVSRSITTAVNNHPPMEPQTVDIPFIGNISANTSIQTFSQTQQIAVPSSFVHSPEKTYALRVQGSSFNEEMIADGDLLLVEARQQAHPGETIVALINGHDTIIKKFYQEGSNSHLVGSLPHHDPIILRNKDLLIQGILIGLLRQYG